MREIGLFPELARVARAAGAAFSLGDADAEASASLSTVETLVEAFGLTPFERDVVLLVAAADLDDAVARHLNHVSFDLALRCLDEPHWSALSALRPLRRWSLLRAGDGPLLRAPLHCDERVLLGLLGVATVGDDLNAIGDWSSAVAGAEATADPLVASAAAAIAARSVVVQIVGTDDDRADAICGAIAASLRMNRWRVDAAGVPTDPRGVRELARAIEREAALGAVLVEIRDTESARASIAALLEICAAPLLLRTEAVRPLQRSCTVVEVPKPSSVERLKAWNEIAGDGDAVRDLAHRFRLGRRAIADAVADASANGGGDDALRAAARRRARRDLDGLASRIEPHTRIDDLVLAEQQTRTLHQIVAHARQRRRVHDSWGFSAAQPRGLGLSVLFRGPSGTGKTSAAEIIATELDADLYRIDLSTTVDKYIGETEKNLRRIFDAAEGLGGVLLFDEADALFGKRSDVHDAHDRYANVEVSYLLQRMETYDGLAVLTSNFDSNIDEAFLRRLNYIVTFPFPDAQARRDIWERVFPRDTPLAPLDYAALARLNVSGGSIRNIALGAAALASDEDVPVGMVHLLRAAQAEYAKFDRPMSAVETAGWVA